MSCLKTRFPICIDSRNMLRKHFIIVLIMSCSAFAFQKVQAQFVKHAIDKKATRETQNLYSSLRRLLNKGILFGHQDDLAYGIGWEYEPGRSDVKATAGAYPAVYGWELGHLELDSAKNLDGVPFKKMIQYIKEVYSRGGINTISWHMNDPVTGATAWSKPTSTVKEILPGGPHHDAYKKNLDKFAAFIQQLKTKQGKMIPVIFRPFHEHTGNWFWWGIKSCQPEEYIALWRFTVAYLKDQKQVHNLLYAYSAAGYKTEEEYAERYPGDDCVDIVGFDAYCEKDVAAFVKDLDNRLKIVETFSETHNKIPALTEVGYNQIPQEDWWTQTLFPVLKKYKLSYLLTWRNWKEEHYFAPYPGQKSAGDFVKFYKLPQILFQDRLTPMKVYHE